MAAIKGFIKIDSNDLDSDVVKARHASCDCWFVGFLQAQETRPARHQRFNIHWNDSKPLEHSSTTLEGGNSREK
jgi:hypothetical protein